jgi:hypothetical protein
MEWDMALVDEENIEALYVAEPTDTFEITMPETYTNPTYSMDMEAQDSFVFAPNNSRNVFRNLTGVNFMNELKATKVKAPSDAV